MGRRLLGAAAGDVDGSLVGLGADVGEPSWGYPGHQPLIRRQRLRQRVDRPTREEHRRRRRQPLPRINLHTPHRTIHTTPAHRTEKPDRVILHTETLPIMRHQLLTLTRHTRPPRRRRHPPQKRPQTRPQHRPVLPRHRRSEIRRTRNTLQPHRSTRRNLPEHPLELIPIRTRQHPTSKLVRIHRHIHRSQIQHTPHRKTRPTQRKLLPQPPTAAQQQRAVVTHGSHPPGGRRVPRRRPRPVRRGSGR